MEYYYLDGLEKKGPYTEEELKTKNITEETMVFADGMANWTAIKKLPDLQQKLFENQIDNNNEPILETKSSEKLSNSKQKKKIKIPSIAFLILGIIVAIGLSFLIVQLQKEQDFKAINQKIDDVFHGKDKISDYQITGVTGELSKPNIFTPTDNNGKSLVEYYNCTSGGFTVLTLTKRASGNGIDIVKYESKNMGYKVPASEWNPILNETQPTYRLSVQEAYNMAMKYLSNQDSSYSPNSYDKIKDFDKIETDFYYIDNAVPTNYSNAFPNTILWAANDENLSNEQFIVWYNYSGKHYEIIADKKAFIKRLIIYSSIGSFIAILLYLIIFYRKRITFS